MLDEKHLTELTKESAISREVIKARGYRTVMTKEALAALGFSHAQQLPPALLVPYSDIHGQNGFYQAKPNEPRTDKQGRPVKYETIPNKTPILDYNPIQPLEWLQDATKRLWIVEGAKKADSHITKLREAKLDEPVLSISGVWNWGKDDRLNPAFDEIAVVGRGIVIVPDGDVWSNDHIKKAMARLKGKLGRKRVQDVIVVGLPENGNAGLDDLYAAGYSLSDFLTLVKSQLQPAVQKAIIDYDRKPTIAQLGDRFIKNHSGICFGLGDWRQKVNGYWQRIDEGLVNSFIHDFLLSVETEGITYNSYNIKEIRLYLKNERFVPVEKWDTHPQLIPLKNGLFDLTTGKLIPHDENLHFSSGLDFAYEPNAGCPLWDRYLKSLALLDDVILFLQEFVGYCLTADTSKEITVWLAGKRGAGKSTFVETMGKLMGSMAGSLSLKDIAESRFGLYALVGKRLVISTENPSVYIKDIELLNKIVSGETIRIEEKYLRSFDYNPCAKILWAMNKLPQVYQPENGFWRRVKIIKFERTIVNKDTTLKERLASELAGIFNWAITGYQRLRYRGDFIIPSTVESATEDYELKNNILGRFIAECCQEGDYIKRKKFYEAYKLWCRQSGHNSQSLSNVTERLDELGYKIGRYHPSERVDIRTAIQGLQLDINSFVDNVSLNELPSHKDYFEIKADSDHSGGEMEWKTD